MKHNVSAVIFDKRGRPLSMGRNSYEKTHPLQAKAAAAVGEPYKVFLHAEISALVRLSDTDRQRAYKMVVMRYNKEGKPMNAKPCKVCQRVLQSFNIIVEHT